jgi:hypothetical protein
LGAATPVYIAGVRKNPLRNPFRKTKKEEPVKAKDDLFAWAALRNPNGPIYRQTRVTVAAKAAGQWVEGDQKETQND